ncbi:MAG: transferase [Mycobacterium sp.]|nr:transferase [Mycobacterium sp.]
MTASPSCRGCGCIELNPVLDLGRVAAADHFPAVKSPVSEAESSHPLRMDLCAGCGLAQLADDDTHTEEPRGIEPLALREQAADAVGRVAEDGWLRGATVREFGSPHGGSWLPLLEERGLRTAETADVVLDSFGIMHDADQRQAFRLRCTATAPGGVLLLQFHSLLTIAAQGQWNSLRHGHFAYYSLTALRSLLADTGMSVAASWEFDLYGGTVLIAAVHGDCPPDACTTAILEREQRFGITEPAVLAELQAQAYAQGDALRSWLESAREAGSTVYAYGASSRAVALFCLAGVDRQLLPAIADASPAKQGRRMPGTDIAIVAPEVLIAATPDEVLLTVPDMLGEVSLRYPELSGRWRTDCPTVAAVGGGAPTA